MPGTQAQRPRKWVAALLGFFAQPLGMLYVERPRWAGVYLLVSVGFVVAGLMLPRSFSLAFDLLGLAVCVVCAVHAYRIASRFPEVASRPWYSRLRVLASIVLGFFAVVVAIRVFLWEPFRLPSASMAPTIAPGSYVIVQKWAYGHYSAYGITLARRGASVPIERGDIVVFDFPPDPRLRYLKRVVALPGERLAYIDGRLSINGKEVPADFPSTEPVFPSEFPMKERCAYTSRGVTCDVPAGHYYVMGDNRDNSSDSRVWGFVPASSIVGKVVHIFK